MGADVTTHYTKRNNDGTVTKQDDKGEGIGIRSVMVPPGYIYDSYASDLLQGEPRARLDGAYANDLVRGSEQVAC